MKPINQRIETLFLEYIYQVYELVEQSKFGGVWTVIEEAIQNTKRVLPDDPKHLTIYFFKALQERFLFLNKLIKTEQRLGPNIASGDPVIASNALKTIINEYEKYISTYRNIFNISREYKRYQYLDEIWRKPK